MFVHAHPDDETIFTGGTVARLAALGHRCVVAVLTSGAPTPCSPLAATRRAECLAACALLGAEYVDIGYDDSGLFGESAEPGALIRAAEADVVERLGAACLAAGATSVVTYDANGIYGHPDHLVAHRAGMAAAARCGAAGRYMVTVDREYLHFVETHVVGHAVNSLLGIDVGSRNTAPIGMPSVEISLTVDVRDVCDTKRAALAAHASQLPADSEMFALPRGSFADVYGFEWYVRHGGPSALDSLDY